MIRELLERVTGRDGTDRPVVVAGRTERAETVAERLQESSLPVERTDEVVGDADGTAADADAGSDADGVAGADVAAVVAVHDPPEDDALDLLAGGPPAPVVVAAAARDPATEARALDAGADDVVPAGDAGELEVLVRRVADVVGRDVEAPVPPASDSGGGRLDREFVAETLEGLNEVAGSLADATTFDEVAEQSAVAANEVLAYPGTSVRIYNEETHELDPIVGGRVEDIESRPSYPVEDTPHGEAWRSQETVVDDIGDDDPYDREVFSQTMYVPIGEYGTLNVGVEEGAFDEIDVLFAQTLATFARTAFQRAERDQQLARTASRAGEFADRVTEAGGEVRAAAERLRAASQEVTESVDEIASGASEQTEDLQRVLDEMDDLLATVEETAATADEVARQSAETAELAERGGERADAGKTEMDRIEERTVAMVEDMRELGTEMERIREVVAVIEGIAEQTNILALNASIEAAKADAGGQGFAVVAEEVKDLAEETRESTEEIADIIEEIIHRTDRAVEEMAELRSGVADAGETVGEALDALDRIGRQVTGTNESIQEISRAIEDQATSVETTVDRAEHVSSISEEVSDQTATVAGVIREQATAIQQVSTSAERLETMAEDLGELTESFSIEEVPADSEELAATADD